MLAENKQIDERTTMRDQNRSAALGRPAMKLLGGGGGGNSNTEIPEQKKPTSKTTIDPT